MSDGETVVLQASDAAEFRVELKVARMSETIKNLIEDAGTEGKIPLPNVTGKILTKVVQYCKHHAENPTPASEDKKDELRTDNLSEWDQDLLKVDQATLFEMILAANYLDIKNLLDATCKTVANMIKGKTPAEIRAIFKVEGEFTPEEEQQVREENAWCEER